MVRFEEAEHKYFEGDKELISVTTLMAKHGLAPNYGAVPSAVLAAKAERGTLIHAEIEEYIKHGEIGFTTELQNFTRYCSEKQIKVLESEFIVHNDIAAGTVDLLIEEEGETIIADIKTTATLHKDAVSWQLSIYAYLSGRTITRGQAFHFSKDGELKVVEIPLKPREQVEKLMETERQGAEGFKQELTGVNPAMLVQLAEFEAIIERSENAKKEAEAQAKTIREAIMAAMEQNAIVKFENEKLRITYVAGTERTTIDTARLKKELPSVAASFEKTTKTKPSIRITLKESQE